MSSDLQRVLITGASGQDGTILATMLAREGVETFGLIKPSTPQSRLRRYAPGVRIMEIDMTDAQALVDCVTDMQPTHIYNFGGFTTPGESWDQVEEVQRINVDAVNALLGAAHRLSIPARFFQASSSHIFEGTDRSPQTADFELTPNSPYARSKTAALETVRTYRNEHGLFAVCGILYNHESPLRSDAFVTRKISKAAARISRGLQEVLELGDIEVARDWGWAPDYVRGMRLMLEAEEPRDYVLATGISHRLSFFVKKAFAAVGIQQWQDYVRTSPSTRPTDTNKMVGDSRDAYRELGWRHTVDFDRVAEAMVRHDLALLDDPETLWQDF